MEGDGRREGGWRASREEEGGGGGARENGGALTLTSRSVLNIFLFNFSNFPKDLMWSHLIDQFEVVALAGRQGALSSGCNDTAISRVFQTSHQGYKWCLSTNYDASCLPVVSVCHIAIRDSYPRFRFAIFDSVMILFWESWPFSRLPGF